MRRDVRELVELAVGVLDLFQRLLETLCLLERCLLVDLEQLLERGDLRAGALQLPGCRRPPRGLGSADQLVAFTRTP